MSDNTRARRGWGFILVGLGGLVGCDHATKYAAKSELEGRPPLELVSSVLDLRYVENRDMAFNLLDAVPLSVRGPLLLIFGALMIGVLVRALVQARVGADRLGLCGLLLITGGGLGNYSDRLVRGYVVDFIHAHHWPVFNVADIWVSVGVGLLLLGGGWRGSWITGRPRADVSHAEPSSGRTARRADVGGPASWGRSRGKPRGCKRNAAFCPRSRAAGTDLDRARARKECVNDPWPSERSRSRAPAGVPA